MTEQESYTILGKLLGNGYAWVFPIDNDGRHSDYNTIVAIGVAPSGTVNKIKMFLQGLPFSYDFVDKLLENSNDFYLSKQGKFHYKNDYIVINIDTGKVGICCDSSGDIAWLNRYKKDWWLKEDIENKEEDKMKINSN